MAVSIASALYVSAGVRIDKISLLGNSWDITNPEIVSFGVLAAYLYFLARYYQHLRDLGDPGPREALVRRVGDLVKRRATALFREAYPKQYETEKVLSNIRFSHKLHGNGDLKGSWQLTFEGVMNFTWPDGSPGTTLIKDERRTEPVRTSDRARAVFWVAFNTRFFTEYYLPFLVALLPVFGLGFAVLRRAAA